MQVKAILPGAGAAAAAALCGAVWALLCAALSLSTALGWYCCAPALR